MARSVEEWIGATPDTPIPPRVRLRVYERDGGRCQCGCGRKIMAGEKWETDHIVAIINGGENRESNLRTLLAEHHKAKTKADVAEKATVTARRMKHIGIRRRSSRPILGAKASGWKHTMSGQWVRR